MGKLDIVPSRQKKSQKKKELILKSLTKLMERYNYDSLTVRNICEYAKISTGTFYYYFSSKENLLTYYLTEDYKVFEENYYRERDLTPRNGCDKSIDIYLCCAEYCLSRGVEYISGFYSTNNKSLFPPDEREHVETKSSFSPIFNKTKVYFSDEINSEMILSCMDSYILSFDLCLIFNGIVYNWCISDAGFDLKHYIRKLFGMYLNNVVTDRFVESYGRYEIT